MEHLRRQYRLDGINEAEMSTDPIAEFSKWFQIALDNRPVEWLEANAMTLATASSDGAVTARIVLLKGFDAEGLCFYTNYESAKGQQLTDNPRASLLFYWPHLEQQVRVEGTVTRVTRELSQRYFASRPRGSQIGAVVSEQSQILASRAELEQRADQLEKQLASGDVPLPDHWGGYRLKPTRFEFWQGRENRLHDRMCYQRQGQVWQRNRLAP